MILDKDQELLSVMKELLTDYKLVKKIYTSESSIVYKGVRTSDDKPIIVKSFNKEIHKKNSQARFVNEYEIIKDFDSPYIIKAYDMRHDAYSGVIILEDFGGYSLARFIENYEFDLELFLNIAIQIIDAITVVHANHVIHKEVNPSNLLINPSSNKIKLIDFGISTVLNNESIEITNLEKIEGTLEYMSPEQTGRTSSPLDYRTDFYSLGITLYELFTGERPFHGSDSIEFIHAHLATQPKPPNKVNDKIPEVVSNIILKLLHKNPENRYQSEFGIKSDLQHCLQQYIDTGSINDFKLAQKDVSFRFKIPTKLYGREREIKELINSYTSVIENKKKKIALVSGYSGIGKTSLIKELYLPVTKSNGYFLSGKFDQLQKDDLYSAVLQAFKTLIDDILCENKETIKLWSKKITEALKSNCQLIIDILPDLELITGKQQKPESLPPLESQNRFYYTVSVFVETVATKEHPILLFIDDLQWADKPSLELLANIIMYSGSSNFYFIGAYRSNEVDKNHNLNRFIEKLEKKMISVHDIKLTPLSINSIEHVINDTLMRKDEKTTKLAVICEEKTQGNPFYLNQFLKEMYHNNFFVFQSEKGRWSIKLNEIANQKISSNVVEVVIKRLHKLNPKAFELIQLAACIGDVFHLSTLVTISKEEPYQVYQQLKQLMLMDLIVPIDSNYKYAVVSNQDSLFRFIHDKVKNTAYNLMLPGQQAEKHLEIARILSENKTVGELSNLFDLINHYKKAIFLITTDEEKLFVCNANKEAGYRAYEAGAFDTALEIFELAMSLLPDNKWSTQYELTFNIYHRSAQCAIITKDFNKAMKLAVDSRNMAQGKEDDIKATINIILTYKFQEKLIDALNISIECLRKYGLKIPKRFQVLKYFWYDFLNKRSLDNMTLEKLLSFPKNKSKVNYLLSKVYMHACMASYMSNSHSVLPILALNSCLSYRQLGLCSAVMGGLIWYSVLQIMIFHDVERSTRLAELALHVSKTYPFNDVLSIAEAGNYSLIMPWSYHLKETLSGLLESIENSLEKGEQEFFSICLVFYLEHFLNSCSNLNVFFAELVSRKSLINRIADQGSSNQIYSMIKCANLLLGDENQYKQAKEIVNRLKPKDDNYLNESLTPHSFTYLLYEVISSYILGDYSDAQLTLSKLLGKEEVVAATYTSVLYLFYSTLVLIKCYEQNSPKKRAYLRTIKKNIKTLNKWAKKSPQNCLHKYYLLTAELMRLKNKPDMAAKYYDQAILESHNKQYVQEEGIAYELAANFYFRNNIMSVAKFYLSHAFRCFEMWGAIEKVKQIKIKYHEELYDNLVLTSNKTHTSKPVSTEIINPDSPDLLSITKSYQAITSESDLKRLIEKILKLTIENIGADKGVVILMRSGKLYVEGWTYAGEKPQDLLESIPIKECSFLPISLIRYVVKKKSHFLSGNFEKDKLFSKDSYLSKHNPASYICYPLIYLNNIIGIFYFENSHSSSVFNTRRLKTLELLASQAAISIENTRLYHSFERFVPKPFLDLLGKNKIFDIELGDSCIMDLTILFTDIRGFTTISETMSANEVFEFINKFLSKMEPVITKNHGFIDKYIGDAIMAIFPNRPEDAIYAGIGLLEALIAFNQQHIHTTPINIGIGIHSGKVALGTIGSKGRLSETVIGDVVNTTSRLEGLNKEYPTNLLLSSDTIKAITQPVTYTFTKVDRVQVKGKKEYIDVYKIDELDDFQSFIEKRGNDEK